ncbi:MAG: AsmA-like C-terminal region-containing protein [Chitinivibrionales bacterium]|nr:AsmA-like C-terminal region-containing protein [Chitinivibrionales bacterium]
MQTPQTIPTKPRRHPILKSILIGLGALFTIVFIAGFIPVSNPALKEKAVQILKKNFVDSCSIEDLTITLWTGVSLKKIECARRDVTGAAFSCSIPRLSVSYHLFPLLFKYCVIKKIALQDPRVRCNLPAAQNGGRPPPEQFSFDKIAGMLAAFPYTVIVRSISLSNADISVMRKRAALVVLKGINLELKVALRRAVTLTGQCAIKNVTVMGQWQAATLTARFQVAGFQAVIDECNAALYGGGLELQGALDLKEGVLQNAKVAVSHLKIEGLYAAAKAGPGRVAGTLDAAMNFGRSPLIADSLKAKGSIKIINCSASDLPLQKSLSVLMALPQLSAIKFSTITSEVSLSKGRIYTPDLKGLGEPLDFTAQGWVDLNGYLSEQVEAVFSSEFSRSLAPIVRNSLLPVNPDRCAFKCGLRGTMQAPQIAIDQRIVNRAATNVINSPEVKSAINQLGKSLEKYFK